MRYWTCQRTSDGVRCGHVNPRRKTICETCGKKRPKTKASPRDVPDVPYEECVRLFGEKCGICGRPPKAGKKLHRDHDHGTQQLRGLLCFPCNLQLKAGRQSTIEYLEAAAAYLRRAKDL